MPVFSGFTGGLAKLLGPTGRYILGYLLIILIASPVIHHNPDRRLHVLALTAGVAACYLVGTLWLAFQTGMTFDKAMMAGVIPFIPGDAAKIVAILAVGPQLKRLSRYQEDKI